MKIPTRCPHCGGTAQVPPEVEGKTGRCGYCAKTYLIKTIAVELAQEEVNRSESAVSSSMQNSFHESRFANQDAPGDLGSDHRRQWYSF